MRSYFNGSGLSCTPPPGSGLGPGRPPHRPGLMSGRASSSSLPRSPDQDTASMCLTSGLGTGSGSGQSGHGSLGSHSSHEVSYMNIYQNTNHPHLYVSCSLFLLLNLTSCCMKLNIQFLSAGLQHGWIAPPLPGFKQQFQPEHSAQSCQRNRIFILRILIWRRRAAAAVNLNFFLSSLP